MFLSVASRSLKEFYERNIKIILPFSLVLRSMTFVYSLSDLLKAVLIEMVQNVLKNTFLKARPN